MGEQLGDVEHLLERVDLDHPGLPEHGVDGLRGRLDPAYGVAHRHALGGAARAHGDDRLAQRDAAGDAGELAGVTDRLEVEQHDLGGVVLLPVLQQVVARHVGAVAGADERREPEATVLDLLEDRRAEGTGLAEEARPAARRHHRRQRRVDRDRRVGVDDAEAVGADQPQAVGPREPDQVALPLPALLAGLGEARGDHDQPVHALGGAVEHDVVDRLGRHGHDRDVHVVGDRRDRRVRRHAGHRGCRRVHDVDPAGVVARHQVAHQRLADRVLAPAGADDRHRARVEEPLDRRRLGPVLAAPHHADRGVGRVDRELQHQHAVLVTADDVVTGVAERLDHPLVVREHLGGEPLDAALATGLGQMLQEQLGDAPTLVLVLDQEGDLGLRLVGLGVRVVAPDRDHPAAQEHHQGHPAVVVDLGEAADVARREGRHRREEAVVLRLVGDPAVELDQQVGVLGPDRPDVGGPAVAQQDVGLPMPRSGGRLCHALPFRSWDCSGGGQSTASRHRPARSLPARR